MAILKKPTKKPEKKEKIPMWHKGNLVTFDVDGTDVEGKISSVDNDEETALVVDDNGDEYTCTFAEMTLKKDEEPEVEEKPKAKAKTGKSKGGADSFAEKFNSTKAATGGGGLPEGKWEAETVEAGLSETDKGLSGFIKYEITEAEHEGRQGVQFYQIQNAEGEWQQGFEFFKGALETLGLIDSDTEINSRADFEEILEGVGKQEVIITVKEKGGYTNIYIAEMR